MIARRQPIKDVVSRSLLIDHNDFYLVLTVERDDHAYLLPILIFARNQRYGTRNTKRFL